MLRYNALICLENLEHPEIINLSIYEVGQISYTPVNEGQTWIKIVTPGEDVIDKVRDNLKADNSYAIFWISQFATVVFKGEKFEIELDRNDTWSDLGNYCLSQDSLLWVEVLGKLNSLVSIASFQDNESIDIHLYHELARDDKYKHLTNDLKNDTRLPSLEKLMFNWGFTASGASYESLTEWKAYLRHKYGFNESERMFNDYLEQEEIEVEMRLYLTGIRLENDIDQVQIDEDIILKSVRDRDEFYLDFYREYMRLTITPKAYLATKVKVKKFLSPEDPERWKEGKTASQKLYDVAILLNLVPSVVSLPFYQTEVPINEVPPVNRGRGGQRYLHYIDHSSIFPKDFDSINFQLVRDAFDRLNSEDKERVKQTLIRFAYSFQHKDEIQIADLVTALETILLEDVKEVYEMRTSWTLYQGIEEECHRRVKHEASQIDIPKAMYQV